MPTPRSMPPGRAVLATGAAWQHLTAYTFEQLDTVEGLNDLTPLARVALPFRESDSGRSALRRWVVGHDGKNRLVRAEPPVGMQFVNSVAALPVLLLPEH